jgi:hypothetical protein
MVWLCDTATPSGLMNGNTDKTLGIWWYIQVPGAAPIERKFPPIDYLCGFGRTRPRHAQGGLTDVGR